MTRSVTFDPSTGGYRKAGHVIPASQVRAELDRALANAARRTATLGDDLRAGRISLNGWRVEMRQIVKETHLYSAALAKGGFAQMGPADFGRVGQIIRGEYSFLEQWTTQIAGGWTLDGRLTSRGALYAQAARGTFHLTQASEMLKRGMDLERSVTHPAEHCQQCLDEEAAGFRPIGQMVPIGSRTCGRNCKCTVVYADSAAPAIGEADILSQPSDAFPPARPGEAETLNAFTTAGGQLTPERQRLHDAIARQQFQGATPVDDPTVYVMGGGPASGKSVMLDKLTTPSNAVTVDPDHLKTLLPEFREGVARGDATAATMVHEESSVLAKRIVTEAVGGRYNMVLDGTGDNSYENLARKVAGYRAGGAKIIANYVTVDTDTAVARAAARGARTGRFVPETYLREVHRNISAIIPRAIEDGLFDELTVWDNNGAAGSAKAIARYADGRLTVYNEALWQRFLAKGS